MPRDASEALRDAEARRDRLAEDRVHVLPLPSLIDAVRSEPEYERNGHGGLLLLKTDELRVVLEVMRQGERLPPHRIRGPATLWVVQGKLELSAEGHAFEAAAQQIVVLPRQDERSMVALEDSSFVLALSLETRDGRAANPSEDR